MTKREMAIARMRAAGYHNDQRARVLLLVESRVNRAVMNSAWISGFNAKAAGVRCDCFNCEKVAA